LLAAVDIAIRSIRVFNDLPREFCGLRRQIIEPLDDRLQAQFLVVIITHVRPSVALAQTRGTNISSFADRVGEKISPAA
jgi:hypothetical protein